jgi:hypothetical protein
MAHPRGTGGLQIIFSFFLGLMVTAFVGVGVYTFHPPDKVLERQLLELDREEQAMGVGRASDELTEEDRARMQELMDARNAAIDANQDSRDAWGRSTSMILITFATLVMVVSLVRSDQLPVISNGLLLGGVFTMVYGVGWIVVSDTSLTRFLVLTAALTITLALGFVRFAMPHGAPGSRAEHGPPPVDNAGENRTGELEARLRALETRMEEAAAALGSRRG